jgi:hypothetical protein
MLLRTRWNFTSTRNELYPGKQNPFLKSPELLHSTPLVQTTKIPDSTVLMQPDCRGEQPPRRDNVPKVARSGRWGDPQFFAFLRRDN